MSSLKTILIVLNQLGLRVAKRVVYLGLASHGSVLQTVQITGVLITSHTDIQASFFCERLYL